MKNIRYPFFAQLIWLLVNDRDRSIRSIGLQEKLEQEGFEFFRDRGCDGLIITQLPGMESVHLERPQGSTGEMAESQREDLILSGANDACRMGLQRALCKMQPGQRDKIVNLMIKIFSEEAEPNRVGIGRNYRNPEKIILSHGPELIGADLYPA